jgi:hypothetical protein
LTLSSRRRHRRLLARRYLRFVEAQDFATTVREHVRAVEYLGGGPSITR